MTNLINSRRIELLPTNQTLLKILCEIYYGTKERYKIMMNAQITYPVIVNYLNMSVEYGLVSEHWLNKRKKGFELTPVGKELVEAFIKYWNAWKPFFIRQGQQPSGLFKLENTNFIIHNSKAYK